MSHSIQSFFHEDTFTFTHLLTDEASKQAALIDPVLDFDQKSGRTSTEFIDDILAKIKSDGLELKYVLETHAHADHLTSADYIRKQCGAKIVIGSPITTVQSTFKKIFNEGERFVADGHQFDLMIHDGEEIKLGDTVIRAMSTPGHTPACHTLIVNDSDVFVGDTIFAPDVGSARCDFPGGDAAVLWDSVKKVMSLGDDVVMHLCHDYPPETRGVISAVTVGDQRQNNIHMKDSVSREEFIKMRAERDATLEMPRLILPSLQVNIRAGALPEAEDNGVSYLKLPLNLL